MASQALGGQVWPNGTVVNVYPAASRIGDGAPSGPAVASATVASGVVSFTGLAENVRYVAYALGVGVGFLVPAERATGDRARIEALEGFSPGVDDDVALLDAIAIVAPGKKKRRVPIADKKEYDLREFWPGTSVPADALGPIHDSLAKSAVSGGRVFVPSTMILADLLVIGSPITPTPGSQMFGVPFNFMEDRNATTDANTGNWSRIRLANGSNCAMIRSDWDNSQSKRGPERSTGQGYNCWNRVDDILLDGNGPNQTVDANVIDLRDAWNFQGRVIVHKAKGYSLKEDNCHVCDWELTAVGSQPYTTGHVWIANGSVDNQITCNTHGGKGPHLLLDNVFGNRISGFIGYSVEQELVRFQNGAKFNGLNARVEQAHKHVIHIDSTSYSNNLDVECYDAGHDPVSNPTTGTPDGSGNDQGPWASVFCDGTHNSIKGSADKRSEARFSQSRGIVFGTNANHNDASALAGGEGLDAGDLIVEYRPASATAPGRIYTNRSRVPAPTILPGVAGKSSGGAAPAEASLVTAAGSLRYRVLGFSATVEQRAVFTFGLPHGVDRYQVMLLTVNQDIANAGDAVWLVEIGDTDLSGTSTADLSSAAMDQQWATNAVVTYGTNTRVQSATNAGYAFTGLVSHWPLSLVVTRKATDAADTLVSAVGLFAVRLIPVLQA